MRLHGASRVKRFVGCEVFELVPVTDDSETEFGVNVIRRGDDVSLSVQKDDCVWVLWNECVHIVNVSYYAITILLFWCLSTRNLALPVWPTLAVSGLAQ